ncbi:hypothetical protein AB0M48_16480 [Lentzea sp. NPDC051208]|uniref:hypothetical protein n=1 Tax=Lentzea sp. NPDC051208 TaxID=3154642 RepID=UPI00342660D8
MRLHGKTLRTGQFTVQGVHEHLGERVHLSAQPHLGVGRDDRERARVPALHHIDHREDRRLTRVRGREQRTSLAVLAVEVQEHGTSDRQHDHLCGFLGAPESPSEIHGAHGADLDRVVVGRNRREDLLGFLRTIREHQDEGQLPCGFDTTTDGPCGPCEPFCQNNATCRTGELRGPQQQFGIVRRTAVQTQHRYSQRIVEYRSQIPLMVPLAQGRALRAQDFAIQRMREPQPVIGHGDEPVQRLRYGQVQRLAEREQFQHPAFLGRHGGEVGLDQLHQPW